MSDIKMVSNPDFRQIYSNNNYLPDMNHLHRAHQTSTEPRTEPDVYTQARHFLVPNALSQQTPSASVGVNPFTFYTHSQTGLVTSNPTLHSQVPLVGTSPYPGGFTFNVPTQANPITGSPTQMYQSRGIYTNTSFPQCHAPGLGASWQHAVPTQMPWGEGMRQHYGISTFTGDQGIVPDVVTVTQSVAQSRPSHMSQASLWSSPVSSSETSRNNSRATLQRPKPSRRLKRHAPEEDQSFSRDSKVFLSEKKMMQSMKELSLHSVNNHTHHLRQFSTSTHTSARKLGEGLRQLREIEDRLELDDSDEETEPKNTGPKVEILSKDLLKPSSLLPQKLLEDITNRRCMEVVLWKPPGDFAKDLAPKSENNANIDSEFCWKKEDKPALDVSDILKPLGPLNSDLCPRKDSKDATTMDVEDFDDFDDAMQL